MSNFKFAFQIWRKDNPGTKTEIWALEIQGLGSGRTAFAIAKSWKLDYTLRLSSFYVQLCISLP